MNAKSSPPKHAASLSLAGAPAKEVNLLALYRKLTDPEACPYPLFYSEEEALQRSDSPSRLRDRRDSLFSDGSSGALDTDGRRLPSLYYKMYWDGEVKQAAKGTSIVDR
jgi:hypothetical protein